VEQHPQLAFRGAPNRWLVLVAAIAMSLVVSSFIDVRPVRAADVQPVLTLDPIEPVVYRGEQQAFNATLTGGPPGGPFIQVSYDGETWETLTGMNQGGIDGWHSHTFVPDNQPLGPRFIRAHYHGAEGYLPATSEVQEQTVARRQAQIQDFQVFSPDYPAILPGSLVRVHATGFYGPVEFDRLIDGSWQEVDGVNNGGSGWWWRDFTALGEGSHSFRARIDDSDKTIGITEEKTITISKGATTPVWLTDLTAQANHTVFAVVYLETATQGGLPFTGTMTITRVSTGQVVATGPPGLEATLPAMPVGNHNFKVDYSGDANFAGSSKTFTVTVTSDTVEASEIALQYTTFYPYDDDYRDTVRISGRRLEPITVSIKIYSPTGSLVRSKTLEKGIGPYSYQWNGRNSSGTILASGKYKVVQQLTDAAGTKKSFTNYVTLSRKRLVTKTAYVTKKGSSISAQGDDGSGSITISSTAGTAKLVGKYPDGWVGVGYGFSMPAATVYKSIKFQVYANASPAAPPPRIGMQNFTTCAWSSTADWNESCFDHWQGLGLDTLAKNWYSTTGNVTTNRHNRIARGMLAVPYGTVTIYTARVKVVYGVLE